LPGAIAAIVAIAGVGAWVLNTPSGHKADIQHFSTAGVNRNEVGTLVNHNEPSLPQGATGVASADIAKPFTVQAPAVPNPVVMNKPVIAGQADSTLAASTPAADDRSAQNDKRLDGIEANEQLMAKNIAALSDEISQMKQVLAEKSSKPTAKIEHSTHERKHERTHESTGSHHVTVKKSESAIKGWTLSASTEGSMAIINDKEGDNHVVHEGDTIDGLTIEKIGDDFVKTNRGLIK
jgi:hypothetical protein